MSIAAIAVSSDERRPFSNASSERLAGAKDWDIVHIFGARPEKENLSVFNLTRLLNLLVNRQEILEFLRGTVVFGILLYLRGAMKA